MRRMRGVPADWVDVPDEREPDDNMPEAVRDLDDAAS